VPDGGSEGEDALQDADGDAVDGAAAVLLEVELALEGVVDGLDDLAQRPAAATARQADAAAQAAEIPAGSYSSLALAVWHGAEPTVERLIVTVTPRMLAWHEGRRLTASAGRPRS
jgi:hypothetical protein